MITIQQSIFTLQQPEFKARYYSKLLINFLKRQHAEIAQVLIFRNLLWPNFFSWDSGMKSYLMILKILQDFKTRLNSYDFGKC